MTGERPLSLPTGVHVDPGLNVGPRRVGTNETKEVILLHTRLGFRVVFTQINFTLRTPRVPSV